MGLEDFAAPRKPPSTKEKDSQAPVKVTHAPHTPRSQNTTHAPPTSIPKSQRVLHTPSENRLSVMFSKPQAQRGSNAPQPGPAEDQRMAKTIEDGVLQTLKHCENPFPQIMGCGAESSTLHLPLCHLFSFRLWEYGAWFCWDINYGNVGSIASPGLAFCNRNIRTCPILSLYAEVN